MLKSIGAKGHFSLQLLEQHTDDCVWLQHMTSYSCSIVAFWV